MGRNRQASFAKRKKELKRQEKAREKEARRLQRQAAKAEGDSPFGDIDPSEAVTPPTDEEMQRAIEHAMNPGQRPPG